MADITNTLELRTHFMEAFTSVGGRSTLSLTPALLPEVATLLDHMQLDELTISQVSDITGTGKMHLRGTATVFQVDCEMQLLGEVTSSQNIELKLLAKPTNAAWTLQDSFDNLPEFLGVEDPFLKLQESFFNALEISNAFFGVANFENTTDNTLAGLSLFGQVQLSEIFRPLTDLLSSNTSSLFMLGTVDLSGEVPLIGLKGSLVGMSSSPLFSIGSLNINSLSLELLTIPPTGEDGWRSSARLTGLVPIGDVNQPTIVTADILTGDFVWTFSVQFPDGQFSLGNGLRELTRLANVDADNFTLPEPVNTFSSFFLSEVHLSFNPKVPKLTRTGFIVASNETWNTPFPDFTIGEVHAGWDFYFYDQAPRLVTSAFVAGTFSIGRNASAVQLEVAATFPDFIISARMRDGDTINLVELIHHYTNVEFEFENALIVEEFEVIADVKQRNFKGFAQLSSSWEVGVGFALAPLSVEVNHTAGSTAATIFAQFTVGEVIFFINADQPGSGDGWQFTGGTLPNLVLPIGNFIVDLVKKFDVADDSFPASIDTLTIQDILVNFNTQTKAFSFSCRGNMVIDDLAVSATLTIDLTKETPQSAYEKRFGGFIQIGERHFDLIFSSSASGQTFTATYQKDGGDTITLKNLMMELTAQTEEQLNWVPEFSLTLNTALFGLVKEDNQSKFLFGVNFGSGMNFSNLPLVGNLPSNQGIGVDDLQLLFASSAITQSSVRELEESIQNTAITLPSVAMSKGISLSATLQLGAVQESLFLPVADEDSTPPPAEGSPSPPPPAPKENIKWIKIQKRLGPIFIGQVGIQYQESILWLMLDSSLQLGPLTLIFDDFGIGSPINRFEPNFRLRGFGLEMKKDPITILGYFTKNPVTVNGQEVDNYAGAAIIKTSNFTLSAIGELAILDGKPSFYIYALLDYPLGGPSFFFITGLAAGFGLNRTINVPAIDQVATYPFVSMAMAPTNIQNLIDAVNQSNIAPIQINSNFLAFGIKFTSFKLIDSFLLIIARFERPFRIDLLGLSKVVIPPSVNPDAKVTPLAEITMAVKGTFIPEEGFLGIEARLTRDSYIISKDCRLRGGFAFYSWFSGPHEGEFVLTLGGYHPRFRKPAHYPSVPRLGFDWKITKELNLTGDMFFALTPSALMAGGSLKATYKDGGLKAWFKVGAAFIISWKPYFYDAEFYVSVGVSYTFWFFGKQTISVELGVDVHVWGPEFSGTATLKLAFIEFTVEFGAGSPPSPPPIPWSEFKASFLPDDNSVNVRILSGLIRTIEIDNNGTKEEVWLINSKEFQLVTDSVVPSERILITDNSTPVASSNTPFGIAPMAKKRNQVSTEQCIKIERYKEDGDLELFNDEFNFSEGVTKNIPVALWGETVSANMNGKKLIPNALTGVSIKPARNPEPGTTQEIDEDLLAFDTIYAGFNEDAAVGDRFNESLADAEWTFDLGRTLSAYIKENVQGNDRKTELQEDLNDTRIRNNHFEIIGYTEAFYEQDAFDAYIVPPQVGELLPS